MPNAAIALGMYLDLSYRLALCIVDCADHDSALLSERIPF